jgi:hypothetical protein
MRIVPIVIVAAAALCGIAPAQAQELMVVAQAADTEMAGEDGITVEGFNGGVGQSGPDANGGAIVIQQLLQQSTATSPTTATAGPYRGAAVSASH